MGLAASAGSAGACGSPAAFACISDQACAGAGTAGVCQLATGFCSFPDPDCPSGQRYGGLAGGGFANTCVAEDSDPTTGGPAPTTDSTAATGGAPQTTQAVDDTSSGAESTTGGDAASDTTLASTVGTSSGESSSTGPAVGSCPDIVDTFDDRSLGAQWATNAGALVTEASGELQIYVTAADDDWVLVDYQGVLDLSEGYARIEMGTGPDAMATQLALFVLAPGNEVAYMMLYEGPWLFARHVDGPSYADLHTEDFDPQLHRWAQIRGENGAVVFETSADGETFAVIHTEPAVFDMSASNVWIGAGNWEAITSDETITVRTFAACDGPQW